MEIKLQTNQKQLRCLLNTSAKAQSHWAQLQTKRVKRLNGILGNQRQKIID